jgi:membrane protein YdbS with pleckstrin-like domain
MTGGMSKAMYCNKCGRAVPVGSRFCNACGAAVISSSIDDRQIEDSESLVNAAPGRLAEDDVLFTIRPTMIYVIVWYVVAVLIVLAVAALMGLLSSTWPEVATGSVAFLVIVAVAVIAFAIPIYKHILRRREVYTLTNHKLEMRYGILSKTVRNIPLRNIQDVTVTASVWQRMIKVGDIEIDSASETGKILLNEVQEPDRYAGMILSELRRRN